MKTYRERYAAWGAFFGKAQATEKTALPSGRIEPNRSWRQRKGGLPDLWRGGDEVAYGKTNDWMQFTAIRQDVILKIADIIEVSGARLQHQHN